MQHDGGALHQPYLSDFVVFLPYLNVDIDIDQERDLNTCHKLNLDAHIHVHIHVKRLHPEFDWQRRPLRRF